MTLIMITNSAFHSSSPMLGNPAWKMKEDEFDEEDAVDAMFTIRSPDHMFDDYLASSGLNDISLPYDIDVMDMADLLDIDSSELSLVGEVGPWPSTDPQQLGSPDMDNNYLNDTVLDLQHNTTEDHHHQQSTSTESIYSTIADDHMYSKWGSRSAETASHGASTSGYSSGTESLVSNEENSVSLLSLTGLPTQSTTSLLTQSAKSLLTHSAKSLLTQSTTSLLTQSATSLVSQQARSLLKKKASAQAETVDAIESPSTRRQSRKRTISKSKPTARNRKWSKMTEDERNTSIIELTDVISTQLGVRERLEAIRIINPQSAVSPTDGEVAIDMHSINDYRFTKLQKFVRLHADDYDSRNTSEHKIVQQQQPAILALDAADRLAACVQNKPGRKRKGRGSRREQKALCQQLSREEQQRMKEIESGLFINEVRISVTNEDEVEEDDCSDVSID